jgi:perosamine synthetase
VIPVDLYGGMPDMDAILAIAERYQVAVVEDAAEAIGSEYHTRKAGSFGAAGVFSFHGSKTLTTGEGGMLVTDSDDLHDRVQFLRDHGRSPDDRTLWNTEIGYKYKMSSLQAALGLAQLQRVDELVHAKRAIFSWYREHLAGVEGLALNVEPPGTLNSYWMSTIVGVGTDKLPKEHIIKALRASNIDSRPFFYPLSSLPAFKDIAVVADYRERNRVAYQLSPYGVNLPSGLNLTEETVARVCAALTTILQGETA